MKLEETKMDEITKEYAYHENEFKEHKDAMFNAEESFRREYPNYRIEEIGIYHSFTGYKVEIKGIKIGCECEKVKKSDLISIVKKII